MRVGERGKGREGEDGEREGGRESNVGQGRDWAEEVTFLLPLSVNWCLNTCAPEREPWLHAVSVWYRDCHNLSEHWKTEQMYNIRNKQYREFFIIHHFFNNFRSTLHGNKVGVARRLCWYKGANDRHSLQRRREVKTVDNLQRHSPTSL